MPATATAGATRSSSAAAARTQQNLSSVIRIMRRWCALPWDSKTGSLRAGVCGSVLAGVFQG